MKIALPIKTPSADAALAPLFGKAKQFAIIDGENIEIVPMNQDGGRAVVGTLIDKGVDVLVTSHMGTNPYQMLKEAGIKIYYGGEKRITAPEIVENFNSLIEVDDSNYDELLGNHEEHGDHHHHGGGCCNH